MPPELLVRPSVDGVGAMLFIGSIARFDGIAITFTRSAHEQLGRRTTSVFDFTLTKAGKKLAVQLTTEHEKFQAEFVAHGALFVFEDRKHDVFTVVLAAAQAPEQLDERACFELIDAAAKRAGITERGLTGTASDQGILRVRRDSWTAYCGRYTKRVWFIPRTETSDGATP